MIVGHIGGGTSSPYEIQKSLRFRASASAYLSRTPSVTGNQTTWALSVWIKRGVIGTQQRLLYAGNGTNSETSVHITGDQVQIEYYSSGNNYFVRTSAVLRDASAWYHLYVVWDTGNVTAADRFRIYINGSRSTNLSATSYPPAGHGSLINSNAYANLIGVRTGGSDYLDGYLSEINFIDGQALGPEYFGEFSSETGSWIPKKYTGTYGTNGFYLPFNDGSTLGNLAADRSGNGNNWTANNISLTSGSSYDWMDDTPTNNFAVLNPISKSSYATVVDGNLYGRGVSSSDAANMYGSVAFSTGFWYAEFTASAVNSSFYPAIGIIRTSLPTIGNNGAGGVAGYQSGDVSYLSGGTKLTGGSSTAYGASFAAGDVISVAVDATNGAVYFAKNGVWQNSGVPTSGVSKTGAALTWSGGVEYYLSLSGYYGSGVDAGAYANFGQRPFAYPPPTGFKALCTKNLPTPSITNPKKHFDVVLATGANIKSTVEALYSDQALMVVKDRANANNWQWFNDVTGLSAILQSNTTSAETTYSAPTGSSVGYGWKAGGAPVTNNAGSIQSQVSANPQAGFSIVTGTMANGGGSFGHGLGAAPGLVIAKRRGVVDSWFVWNKSLSNPQQSYLVLNGTAAQTSNASIWNGYAPTSLVFSLGGGFGVNGDTFVAYCFAEIPGYSKIGSYTGNGSADGPFVYCGFRPRYVMVKRVDSTGEWVVLDSARATYNVNDTVLFAHLAFAEQGPSAGYGIDFTANGFKVRSASANVNGNGGTYVFIAFAEAPFNFANAR